MMRQICFLLILESLMLVPGVAIAQVEFRKPTWQDVNPSSRTAHPSLSSTINSGLNSGSNAGQPLQPTDRLDSEPGNKTSSPKPIVTRQNAFGVPFSVNSDVGPIREVQLHVSTNQGATWSLYGRQLPSAREFPFRAAVDGEYWFAVKTVGSTIAERKLEPELIIIVDSTRPKFDAALNTDALGRLVIRWRAADLNLEPESIQLAYQSVAPWGVQRSAWQPVRLPQPKPSTEKVYEDEIAFHAATNHFSIDLRISIADRAGNVAVVTRRFNLPRTATRTQKVPAEQLNIATRISGNENLSSANEVGSRVKESDDRPPSTDPYSIFTQKDKDNAAQKIGLKAGFSPQTFDDRQDRAKLQSSSAKVASSENRGQGWHLQGSSGFQQDFFNNQPDPGIELASKEPTPSSVSDPGFQNPHRFASSRSNSKERLSSQSEEAYQRGSNINRIPSGQYAKLSSSKKFELDYSVEHIQSDDIAQLEIWVTEDAGQSWKLGTTDPDRQSPVKIEVEEDGVYGYRIRIQTIDGLESKLPSRGDSADVWVEVDTTRPSVKLKSIPYGRRADAGKLIINWQATDRRLALKPITLFYAVDLDGPWQIIVERLENTGQFKWPVTDRIPRNVYLRIEAIDSAGNKNYHQTEQTIDLSGLNPRGMIRGIRPIE